MTEDQKLKKYEATFRITMPGQVKENEYKIPVSGDDPAEATLNAIAEWKRATEPRDVRVKEIAKVMTA
jgi:hypothetical protein